MVYRQLYDKIIYIYDYMYHYVSVFVNIYQHAAIISNHFIHASAQSVELADLARLLGFIATDSKENHGKIHEDHENI